MIPPAYSSIRNLMGIFSERARRRERQGAATGLAVSALNHVAHRMTVISRVDAALAAEGINPTDEVVARGSTSGMTKVEVEALLTGRAMSLISKMDELSKLYDIAGNPTVSIDHSRGNVAGHTTGTCEIFLAHRAFRNYRTLFLSIGHELYHSALVYTGHWNKWKGFTQSNGMLKNYSEYLSWSWDDYWGGTSNAIEYYDSRMVNKFGKWYPFYLK